MGRCASVCPLADAPCIYVSMCSCINAATSSYAHAHAHARACIILFMFMFVGFNVPGIQPSMSVFPFVHVISYSYVHNVHVPVCPCAHMFVCLLRVYPCVHIPMYPGVHASIYPCILVSMRRTGHIHASLWYTCVHVSVCPCVLVYSTVPVPACISVGFSMSLGVYVSLYSYANVLMCPYVHE